MSVYVDPLVSYGWCFRGRHIRSCHLFSGRLGSADLEALLAFASGIGLKPEWLQQRDGPVPHFDLTAGKRARAVKAGAVELTAADAVNVWRALRGDPPLLGPTRKEAGCRDTRAGLSSAWALGRDNFGDPGRASVACPGLPAADRNGGAGDAGT